jgi:energy-coupling factor transport system permease protein
MNSLTLGNYYPGNSLLHKIDPRIKLSLSLVFMIGIFFLDKPLSLGVYALGILVLILISQIDALTILKQVRPVIFFSVFAFVINIFSVPGDVLARLGPLQITRQGLITGFLMMSRLILLVIGSSLLMTLTTTSLLLADSIESLLSPLKAIKVPVHDIAMMISIALRFIPTLADEADKIMKAQSSRGANYDTGKFFDRIKGMVTILIPLFVSAIKRAEDLAVAMESRCYRGDMERTKYKPLKLQARDIIFLIVALLFMTGVLLIQFLL